MFQPFLGIWFVPTVFHWPAVLTVAAGCTLVYSRQSNAYLLIAATLVTSKAFASTSVEQIESAHAPSQQQDIPDPSSFAGSVWGMPDPAVSSAKAKAKIQRMQEKMASEFVRASRIKIKSRATLIICPLSTVANWEDQFKDHWKGEVFVIGGAGGCTPAMSSSQCSSTPGSSSAQPMALLGDVKMNKKLGRTREVPTPYPG
ncbi:uncharacterized protein C8R40DRAFT_1182079 [Lentinula edodes]|uniref:uncharacterized protein n=1 Tax=Lentinula edodes TaxID=5353 RepID=UPI001E8E1576|nr:uncharacterized protein C8R40DRAFT_1182079 [Lentinula edodes]KAH7877322.1 hypothetical protein C8R40DRAFT_1182079 [Lentinula edodes]KAJ3911183.1 hypothetical protein F5877DRAFT_86343 [Lentinula edodes]